MKKLLLVILLSFATGCTSEVNLEYPLASRQDPPPGKETTPEEANVYLGRYKTCSAYADYVKSQVGFFARVFIMSWTQYLQDFSTVDCRNGHTCHCESHQYFTDDFGGRRESLYRCIEPPSAGVEKDEIYAPNESFSEAGVIKFALPRSVCDK